MVPTSQFEKLLAAMFARHCFREHPVLKRQNLISANDDIGRMAGRYTFGFGLCQMLRGLGWRPRRVSRHQSALVYFGIGCRKRETAIEEEFQPGGACRCKTNGHRVADFW